MQLFVHNKYAICCMDETVAPLSINPIFVWSYSSAARGSSNQTQHYMSLIWLQICAWQFDIIRPFGSSYSYNHMYTWYCFQLSFLKFKESLNIQLIYWPGELVGNGGVVNLGVAAVVVGASVVLDDDDVKLPVRKTQINNI